MGNRKINNVLIIDDNEIDQFITQSVIKLAKCDAEVHSVSNVNEALYFLQKGLNGEIPIPELILLDIHMPVLNGWNFLTEYQKLSHALTDKIVLVMFSSSINKNDRKQAANFQEIADFIEKPITVDKFNKIEKENFHKYEYV
ncbi:MAG: response regulator [Cyclobacteriaceae bacterium]|nr:response regulator [Cyclobacteriaceae bacterium]